MLMLRVQLQSEVTLLSRTASVLAAHICIPSGAATEVSECSSVIVRARLIEIRLIEICSVARPLSFV